MIKKFHQLQKQAAMGKGRILPENLISCKTPPWKQLWIINTASFSNHRMGSCHCCEKLLKPVHVQKKTSISEVWSLLQPFSVPFQRGHKTCQYHLLFHQPKQQVCGTSRSSRLSDLCTSGMIPYCGAFPHIYTLIDPGSWTKPDLKSLRQLQTLGSIFSLYVF